MIWFTKKTQRLASSLCVLALLSVSSLFAVVVLPTPAHAASTASRAPVDSSVQPPPKTTQTTRTPGSGCYVGKGSSTFWQSVPCSQTPDVPLIVGNTHDWIASPSDGAYIGYAQGSFQSVTGLTSETNQCTSINPSCDYGGQSNYYSLQLNTQNNFACQTAYTDWNKVSNCWEQFDFTGGAGGGAVFIQYWLLNYVAKYGNCAFLPTIPDGDWIWRTSPDGGSCYADGPKTSVPSEPVSNLAHLTLTAWSNSAGDQVILYDSSTNEQYAATTLASVLDLYQNWQSAEFNVFGYDEGSNATFNSGTSITINDLLQTSSGVPLQPSCHNNGFTSETNNLNTNFCDVLPPPETGTQSISFTEASPSLGPPLPSVQTPDFPSSIMLGQSATIKVKVANNGGEAGWQTIAVSFPPDRQGDVQIVSSDIQIGANDFITAPTLYPPPDTLSGCYSGCTSSISYPIVQGLANDWPSGGTHYMTVTVTPPSVGSFAFYVKSIAGMTDAVAWDPASQTASRCTDNSPCMDQQSEYVNSYTINVLPGPPDFSLSVSPMAVNIPQGGSSSTDVTVTSVNDYSSSVALSVSNLPSGVTASFSSSSGTPSFSSTLDLSAASGASPGSYSVTITGAGSDGTEHSTTLSLDIGGAFDFSATFNPLSGQVVQGNSISTTLQVKLLSGQTQPVSFQSISWSPFQPSGITESYSQFPTEPPFSVGIVFGTSSSTQTGTYTISVTEAGGGYAQTATYTLIVSSPSAHTVSVSVTPNPYSVYQGLQTEYTAVVRDTSNSPTVPTGLVSWNDEGAGGIFVAPGWCQLAQINSSASSCRLPYDSPSSSGAVTIRATYAGDSTHGGGVGSASLTILGKSSCVPVDDQFPTTSSAPRYRNQVVANISVGGNPWLGIAYDPLNGYVFTDPGSGYGTLVINTVTNDVICGIVGANGAGIAYDSWHNFVYVTDYGGNNVYVIDASALSIVAKVPLSGGPLGAVFDPANGDVYILTGDSISIMSGTSIVGSINFGEVATSSWNGVYDPANNEIFLGDRFNCTIAVIDARTNAVIGYTGRLGFNGPGGYSFPPYFLAYDPTHQIITSISTSYPIVFVNASTKTILGGTDTVLGWGYGAYSTADGLLYIPTSSGMVIMNDTSEKVVGNMTGLGNLAQGMVYDPQNQDIYSLVANPPRVSVIYTGSTHALTNTAISCTPLSFAVGSPSLCTSTVSGGSSPTGTATFTQSGAGSVALPNPATCILFSGSCSLMATGASAGNVTIQATYSGDSNDVASSGTTTLAVTSPTTPPTPTWTSLTPTNSPPARYSPSMVYDAADEYTLLFGGTSGTGVLGDTWTFSGGSWTQLSPPTSPSARWGAAMVYDAADGYVLLFGGEGAAGTLSDTWAYKAGEWTQLSPSTSPPARYWAGIAYDNADGCVILFSGINGGTYYGDTWEFKGGVWTQLSPSTSPEARAAAGMSYDSTDGYVLLFGGSFNLASSGGGLDDTWAFSGGSWTQLSPSTSPPDLDMMSMTYSPGTSSVLLFGGWIPAGGCGSDSGAMWEFLGESWTQLSPSVSPAARQGAGLDYDSSSGNVILFGGVINEGASAESGCGTPAYQGDTWQYGIGSTSPQTTTTTNFSCYPSSISYVGSTTCTAAVSNGESGYDAPSGTVTFSNGPTGFPVSCTLSGGTCSVTFSAASNTEGSYNMTASYSGDSSHEPSSGSGNLAVYTTTAATVSCSPSPGTISASESCTATVVNVDSNYAVEAIGIVTFNGTLPLGMPNTCTLVSGTGTSDSCSVAWTPASGTEGGYSMSATYSGDISHLASTYRFSLTVEPASPSTTVACDLSTVPLGTSTPCTATVFDDNPTGIVSWSHDGTGNVSFSPASAMCTLSLSGGVASCSVIVWGTGMGSVTLTADYLGDQNNLPSSGVFDISVNSVVVSCSPLPVVGRPTTCTATIVHPSTPTPTGKVTWYTSGSGKFSLLTCVLSKGSCKVRYTPASAGIIIIMASYAGDKANPTSSGTFSLTVTQKASTTSVSCSLTSVVVGSTKTIKCTAHVTGYLPTGSVSWSNSGTGSVALFSTTCSPSANGRCSVTMTATAAGPVTIHAGYGGDWNNAPSSGTAGLKIKQAKTSLTLTCKSISKDVWTCTATLMGYYGSVASETIAWTQTAGIGTVSFSSPTCTLSSGSCSVTVTRTSPGKVTIEAVYAGDTNNLPCARTDRRSIS